MSWIQTYNGLKFHPFDPDFLSIQLQDIAHSLSLICRFNGHCNFHYSVAQHSLYVAELIYKSNPTIAIYGLLHDAAEAYIGDIVSPIKRNLYAGIYNPMEAYEDIEVVEERILKAIASRFGLVYPFPEKIREADMRVLCAEMRQIMKKPPEVWDSMKDVVPAEIDISQYNPHVMEVKFMEKFYDYMKLVN